jgi:hypothetical protein
LLSINKKPLKVGIFIRKIIRNKLAKCIEYRGEEIEVKIVAKEFLIKVKSEIIDLYIFEFFILYNI